jgi:hypothetical protein
MGPNTGGEISSIHVTVRETAAVLQPSVAVQVRVCERLHPDEITGPSDCKYAVTAQLSLKLAVPNAALIADVVGLQPRLLVPPLNVIVGIIKSTIQLIVLEAVAKLPQSSVAVQDLVCV